MCGIVGYVGGRPCRDLLIAGLEKLEYRGYDSAGVSLLESSSLDLVYHYYRLVEPATSLRLARLDPELTGRQRDLGHELDLVLALEEWKHVEVEATGSIFRTGHAFGDEIGEWLYGGSLRVRLAF